MQTRQRILTALRCKYYSSSRQNSETFDISHAFLSLTIAKLSTVKKVNFLAHHVQVMTGILGTNKHINCKQCQGLE